MKEIIGYEGKYAVDLAGNVWSLNYRRTGKTKKLKLVKNSTGYMQVLLWKNGKYKHFLVSRLVAQAYLDGFSEDLEVDHIDRNPLNNSIQNLRVVNHQENHFNKGGKGWSKVVRKNGDEKFVARIVLNGKNIYLGVYDSASDAEAVFAEAKSKLHVIEEK